jgi:hypothetical protein
MTRRAGACRRCAGQLYAASSPQNWTLFIPIPGALIPAILVGSSGDASATALDPIAAWHSPGVLASDGYGRDALLHLRRIVERAKRSLIRHTTLFSSGSPRRSRSTLAANRSAVAR